MSNEDIADALGTTFVEDDSLQELTDINLSEEPERVDSSTELIKVDASTVAVSARPDDFDTEDSVYIREKLKIVTETSEKFFDMVAKEFRQAPTAKMAESASKILDTQVSALSKLVDIDESRKKRKFNSTKTQNNGGMNAGGNINVTQNIITNREDLLKYIKQQEVIDAEVE